MNDNPFRHAPPVVTIDSLQVVPIDITNVTATFIFDAAAQTATADATMSFVMGSTPREKGTRLVALLGLHAL